MFAMAFLAGRRKIVAIGELLTVYASSVDLGFTFMAGAAFHQRKPEFMG